MASLLSLFPNEPEALRPELPDATAKIVIVVHGEAAPAGSKRIVPVGKRGGPTFYRSVDANRKVEPWKKQVAYEAAIAMGERALLRGPLEVTFTFFKRRPKGHYGARGNLLPSAPTHPTTRPDATKLVRGVEDALTGVVWNDDAQIVAQGAFKCWGEPERCVVVVRELGA